MIQEVDAAYIYFKYPLKEGESSKTLQLKEDFILDLDSNGKIIGLEILNASKNINEDVIKDSIIMGLDSIGNN